VAAGSDLDWPNLSSSIGAVRGDDDQPVNEDIAEFGLERANNSSRRLPAAKNEHAVKLIGVERLVADTELGVVGGHCRRGGSLGVRTADTRLEAVERNGMSRRGFEALAIVEHSRRGRASEENGSGGLTTNPLSKRCSSHQQPAVYTT
jgi:hypothetical protein